jgi:hypothetical protein
VKRAVPEVAYSTIGQSSPSHVTMSKPYRWRGVKDWVPGDERFREDARPGPGGAANASRRNARLEQFAVVLAGISGGRPEHASDAHVRKAGELVGVGEKTAKAYRKALLREEESRDD